MRRAVLSIGVVLLLVLAGAAGDKKEDKTSDVSVVVTKETNGKPVRNATVVFHTLNDDGKQAKGGINLKTDENGKTGYRGVPYGKLRVQVIARGLQTFGEDMDIDQPEHTFEIKMKPPKDQYSIYK